jgi:AsmA-like C-terminal region
MLRRIRNVLFALALLVVLGVGTLVVLAHLYETEVKVKLVGALNERLLAPVTVSDMDLTLIARFPMASMRLHDVKVDEVRTDGQPADTLLAAKELFLEFNLWDLFEGNYRVQKIHGKEVQLFPGLDANGATNYMIWRADSTSTASSPIALEEVSVDGLRLRYHDDARQLVVSTTSNALSLAGRFDAEQSEVRVRGDVHVLGITSKEKELLGDRAAQLALTMSFGGGAFRIDKGEVTVGGVPLEVSLAYEPHPKGDTLDLRANGLGLDIADLIAQLPVGVQAPLKRFSMKGQADIAIRYTGPADSPTLSIGAQVAKARMREQKTGAAFTDIYGDVAMDLAPDGSLRMLKVKDLRARSGNGTISGNWLSAGGKKAKVSSNFRCDVGLSEMLRFAGVDTLEDVSGRLVAEVKLEGTLRDMTDLRAADLKQLRASGKAALHDASLKMKGVRHRIESLEAELAVVGNDAQVRGLQATIQGNAVELSGTLHNLLPYLLLDDERLLIEARGSSPRLDLAALLMREDGLAAKGADDYALVLPASIDLDLKAKIGELAFEDFRATNISGTIVLKDRVLRVSPMAFNTADGAVLGSLVLDGRGGATTGAYPLAIEATVKDIDITALFREFQDFGQEFIGHRHLSGRAQASITFTSPLSPALLLDRDRLRCTIDIALDNGGIKGHDQLLAIADHLRKNKLVSPFVDTEELRRRLADVRFARLENRIEIRDGAVHVPMMEVRSTALDIALSGTHAFDDRIDHHLNFRLGELFRMGKPADEQFGPVADDGTGMRVFLHMYGTASAPQFANDGAMAANRRREQFQQEKQELRAILREDILGQRTDGATAQAPGNSGRIIIEEETDSARTVQAQPRKPRRLFGEEKEKPEPGRVIIED